MELITLKIGDIRPYERNARKNDHAVDAVAESIRQCEYIAPIIVDENHVILAGHTRWKALKKLGRMEAECVVKAGLTDEQKRKYRLLDNKTAELADWDFDLLADELEGLDFGGFDFGFDFEEEYQEENEDEDTTYTDKTDIPQYEPSGEKVSLNECIGREKTEELIKEIEASSVTDEEKEFLKSAAMRHLSFTYKRIADYYATASKEMQELMEKSALVIIDYDDAIKYGYMKLRNRLEGLRNAE